MTRKPPFAALVCAVILLFASGCVHRPRANTPSGWRAAMQPSIDTVAKQEIADGLSLHRALALALERNPGIQAERARWRAAIAVEPQAVTPPDPMLEFDNLKTGAVSKEVMIGLTQQIPWWQKLWTMGKMAAADSDIARLTYEAAVRDLIVDVKDSYYELYYLDQAQDITRTIETLFRNDAVLAYQELAGGRTQLNEAFRAESQSAQLAYDRILLTEQRASQAERLRSLLNLPPGTAIGPVRTAPVYEIADGVEPLYERAEIYSESLKTRGLEIVRARYETFLAKLQRVPDATVGATLVRIGSAPKEMNAMGEKVKPKEDKVPSVGLLSMSLPIWEWRNRALVQEKQALEEAMRRDALEETNAVRRAVAEAYFAARLTDRLASLYHDTLLPQAESVMRQAEIDFRNDVASFSSQLESTLAYHNFLLAYHRALADHGQAIGRLEQVIGATADPHPDDLKE
ncbi:MAG: TolC family protein [Candidatus Sumerlaeota bacterium]|nr:TolC family protein [Candidatus Sumerlaeota bacterium]